MCVLFVEIIKGIFTLATVALGAWIGLRLYFRQKEYELIKQRYLEGAVDIVTAEIEQALGTVSHNWARCLNIVKAFRDAQNDFDAKELEKGFLELDSSRFHRVPHHRIRMLTKSEMIWQLYQLAMAFAADANSKITKEIPEAIRIKLTTARIQMDPKSMAEAMAAELKQLHDDSHKFAVLTRELQVLGQMFERERLNFKSVLKFSERPQVEELLTRLRSAFAEALSADENEAA
jgi:hypothetical protein